MKNEYLIQAFTEKLVRDIQEQDTIKTPKDMGWMLAGYVFRGTFCDDTKDAITAAVCAELGLEEYAPE